ncbi:MAG TPA: hypothetical protein VLT58_12245, partial [Polyangia bacterium]|nr:hypothetical protein [Polyangia bacterium]
FLPALLVGGCGGGGAVTPSPGSGGPWLTLPAGSAYFEAAGRRAPVVMRNVSAGSADAFTPLFAAAHASGTTLVRLQLTQGLGYDTLGIDAQGRVLPDFAAAWDAVIDDAGRQQLAVIPVLAIWGDWNDGTPDYGWTHFSANPLAQSRGGPAASPADLFADTDTQRAWLAWASALVARWSGRANVVAWESFSELDLATGATAAGATAFAERAAAAIRAADPLGRPVYASTSDLPLIEGQPWTNLWASSGADLASLHTYAADLDAAVIARVRTVRALTDKPIFLGESGLDAGAPDGTTLTTGAGASVGLGNALWAELMSGSATVRALYWEDGYAAYYPASGLPLVTARDDLERPLVAFMADKEFAKLAPLGLSGRGIIGDSVGAANRVLGWARNVDFVAPAWNAQPLADAAIDIALSAGVADGPWSVAITLPHAGSTMTVAGAAQNGVLSFVVGASSNRVVFDAAPVSWGGASAVRRSRGATASAQTSVGCQGASGM